MRTEGTREAILDATLDVMTESGLARLSLEQVAQAASLSRQTVYRYFGSRDALIAAVIVREEDLFIAKMRAAAAPLDEPRPAIEAALAAALHAARDHPLLDRLLATEPEALLPFLTTGAGPVLPAARPALEALLTEALPRLGPEQVRWAADAMTRLFISYAINPSEEPVEVMAAAVAGLLTDGLTRW